ncbi:MAG: thrombospondin type 3 repeat-containing protein [Gammaproteobacteria bacterium]|nr:thrombospondin type 3 repeat-containing protein [Gammaproteobacteria bacterium]
MHINDDTEVEPDETFAVRAREAGTDLYYGGVLTILDNDATDLSASVTPPANAITTGQPATFIYTVHNNGPLTAPGSAVTIELPGALDITSATTSTGTCEIIEGGVNCTLTSISVGANQQITVTVVPQTDGVIATQVTVDSIGNDSNTNNDSASTVANTSFNAQNYFPLSAGLSWTRGDEFRTQVPGDTLLGIQTVELQGPIVDLPGNPGVIRERHYYAFQNDRLRLYKQVEHDSTDFDGSPRDVAIDFAPAIPLLNATAAIGDQIIGSGTASYAIEGINTFPLSYTSTSTVVGHEILTGLSTNIAPNGVLATVKIVFELAISGTITNAQGQSEQLAVAATETYWLADGIGIVKTTSEVPGSAPVTTFTTSFTNDVDGDGIHLTQDNCPTVANANQADYDNDGLGDACDPDDDNDGVLDTADAFPGNAAESSDNDHDGIGDNADPDDDNDGMSDAYEIANGLNRLSSADAGLDPDQDGLTNLEEYQLGTAANKADTDGDGVNDGDEVAAGTDPRLNIGAVTTIIINSVIND